MPVSGIVTVHMHTAAVRSERARRRRLERLLHVLDDLGVTRAVIESRNPQQDQADRGLLTGLRRSKKLSRELIVEWIGSHEEPLPWAADAVVGATTGWLDGRPECFDVLADRVRVICVDEP